MTPTSSVIFATLALPSKKFWNCSAVSRLVNDDELALARHEGVVDDPTALRILGDLL